MNICKTLLARMALCAACLTGLSTGAAAQDSIPEFDRGMSVPTTFVPKGQWITGVSVSYSASSEDNYNFFIFEKVDGKSYSFKVSPMVMYAFKDNLALGGRLTYNRTLVKVNNGSLKLSSDVQYDADHLYLLTHSYGATAAFRNYIALGGGSRFGIFNEVQLNLSGGQTKFSNGSGTDITGTYSRNFNMQVGLTPGMVMFLSNYSAIEVNVGVLGFNYSHATSITNQIYEASVKSNSANFKINLFSITFGATFYL